MRFHYRRAPEWPVLAWLAVVEEHNSEIDVFIGDQVETEHEFFCEAIWAGPYEDGGFDLTDRVFGSGCRRREGSVIFVSSASTVDRLHSLRQGTKYLISNSLPCLLHYADAVIDPRRDYFDFFQTIISGIRDYSPNLETSKGSVLLTYYNNLLWNGEELILQSKIDTAGHLTSFSDYKSFLISSLQLMADNMQSPHRQHRYSMIGTISSGYDSATATLLGCSAGLKQAISFTHARSGDPDSGEATAAAIGVELILLDRDAWRLVPYSEVPFIASDAKGEDVFFRGAEYHLRGRAVLTGAYGGKLWDRSAKLRRDAELRRKDQSGLSLTEYRLWVGFIHCPVAFLGARHETEIFKISTSPELAEWDIPGDYSKPICRRLLEDAGVPRRAFGMTKNAASVLLWRGMIFRKQLSPGTWDSFNQWLRSSGPASTELGRRLSHVLNFALALAGRTLMRLTPFKTGGRRLMRWAESRHLSRQMFPWAVEEAKSRYSAVRPGAKPVETSVGLGVARAGLRHFS